MTSKDVMLDALIQVRNEKRAPGYLIPKDGIVLSSNYRGLYTIQLWKGYTTQCKTDPL